MLCARPRADDLVWIDSHCHVTARDFDADRETVLDWEPQGEGVTVRTNRDTYTAGRLVVTAGPWAAK